MQHSTLSHTFTINMLSPQQHQGTVKFHCNTHNFHRYYLSRSRDAYLYTRRQISLPVSQKWHTHQNAFNTRAVTGLQMCIRGPVRERGKQRRICKYSQTRMHPRTLLFSISSGHDRYLALSSGHKHVLLMLAVVRCTYLMSVCYGGQQSRLPPPLAATVAAITAASE